MATFAQNRPTYTLVSDKVAEDHLVFLNVQDNMTSHSFIGAFLSLMHIRYVG